MGAFSQRSVVAVLVAALVAVGNTPSAWAQSAEAKVAAEALFEEGRKLLAAGRAAEACPKLAESNALDTGVGTLLHLGACYEQVGRSASAWATFREAAALAARQGDKREALARERSARLEASLPRVVVHGPRAPQGADVQLDGQRVPPAAFGVAMPVDPGEHVVRATAPGYLPWEQRVRAVAPSAAAPAPPPAEVRVPGLTVDPAATPAPRKHWTVQRIVGASLVGVGVGGSATALGLALAAKSRYDSAVRDLCESPTACTEDGVREQTSAIRMADQATVVLIASGAAAAIGVVLYLTSPSPRASAPRSLQVTPLAAPGFAGAVFGGRF